MNSHTASPSMCNGFEVFGSDESDGSDNDDAHQGGIGGRAKALTFARVDSNGRRFAAHPASHVNLFRKEMPLMRNMLTHVGPIVLERNSGVIGGGRGFVAGAAIAPGTLLLAEQPLVRWSDLGIRDGRTGRLPFEVRVLSALLKRGDASQLVEAMDCLYPRTLTEYADQTVVAALRCDAGYTALLNGLPNMKTSADLRRKLSADEALRLILALRSNAFASGLYLHFAMFNHACMPNCIKYQPLGRSSTALPAGQRQERTEASEVRATRWIAPGEPLTLSYLLPREQSRRHRRDQLWAQFRFRCLCSLCRPVGSSCCDEKGGCTDKNICSSARNAEKRDVADGVALGPIVAAQRAAQEAHVAAAEAEAMCVASEEDELWLQSELEGSDTDVDAMAHRTASRLDDIDIERTAQMREDIKACSVMATTLSTLEKAKGLQAFARGSLQTRPIEPKASRNSSSIKGRQQVSAPVHVLYSRALRLVVDACAVAIASVEPFLATGGGSEEAAATSALSRCPKADNGTIPVGARGQRQNLLYIAEWFLDAAAELCDVQICLLGPDHPDLAGSHQDVSVGLNFLLRHLPTTFQRGAGTGDTNSGTNAAPKEAISVFPPPEWSSISLARTAELKARRVHARIRALFA
jgi:hypothetical protein